ncbi:MAG: filamentous hemagglutinin N-terminal domain-containing protein [Nitrospiraceae bacterium]
MPFGRTSRGIVLAAVLVGLTWAAPSRTDALPGGGTVGSGQATIQQVDPQTLTVQQGTNRAILNWQQFSIGSGETVRFLQPSANAVALNRVVGLDPSVILGHLQANGQLFLVNPNGILFGAGAQVNVAGLLATTLQIRDSDFMAGKYLFAQDPLKELRSVVNRGEIRISDHGYAVFVAPGVANEGLIVGHLGTTLLGSAQRLTLDLMGDGLIRYVLSDKVATQVRDTDGTPLASAVSNSGTIQAPGGQVILSAKASGDIFSSVVNQSGVIRAQSLVERGGVIRLEGSDPVQNSGVLGWQQHQGEVRHADGRVLNTGTLDVSAAEAQAQPGTVTLSGQMVGVGGTILARGATDSDGGNVLATSSDSTVMSTNAHIDTSGADRSSAGNVVLWSDGSTAFRGTIAARGGEAGGDGGQIETSGHRQLEFTGQVDATAPNGQFGSVLLDPTNITVATGGTATLSQVDQFADPNCAASLCTIAPTTINGAGANVLLQADNDITISNAISMTGSGLGITMRAGRDILVNAGVATNNGAIAMTANDAGAGGTRSTGTGDISGTGTINAGTANIDLTIGTNAGGAGAINLTGALTSLGTTTVTAGSAAANNVTLSSATNNFGTVSIVSGNNVTLRDSNALILGASSISGTLNVTTNGALTQSGAVTVAGTTTIAAGSSNAVTLTTAGNNFSTVAVTSGNNVSIADSNALILGASTISGTLGVTTNGALTQSGAVTATGTTTLAAGAANDITLNNASNNFSTVAVTTGNNVTLRDSNALALGASTVSGNLDVTTAGAITQSGTLTVAGTTTLAAGSANAITLTTATNNFNTVTITSGGNVSLRDAGALDLGASTVSGTLGVTTAGAMTQSGPLTVTGATTLTAGAGNTISLTNAANNFSTLSIVSGNNVSIADSNALILGASTVSGTLDITTNGALTQSGAVTATGTTTLAAGAANDITLNNASNNFSTVAVTSGNNVTLRDSNALILGASTIGGNLATTTGGALSQSGVLTVGGTSTFSATAAASDILLGTQANTFSGALAFGGTLTNIRDVSIRNVNAGATVPSVTGMTNLRNLTVLFDAAPVVLPAFTLVTGGNLTATAAGSITQSGAIVIPGTATLTAGSNDITLSNAGNNFGTVAVTTGNNVTLRDSNALILGASTISGTLSTTTGGALSQSGVLTVGGTSTFSATAAASDILLGTQANNFSGALAFGGTLTNIRDVSIRNVNAGATVPSVTGMSTLRNLTVLFDAAPVVLPAFTLATGGNLTVTAGGTITQSGAIVVPGTATLTAGSNDITLSNAGNNFGTVAVTTGNNVTLRDSGALILGASTIGGNLDITTNGALTQTAALSVAGTTTIAAGSANAISLTTATNNFNTVAITSGGNVSLRDADALDLGASTISGTLGITTAGALTQSGALTVTGVTTLATGAGNDITLNNAANNFSTMAVTSGNNVTLVDSNALVLGTSTVSGTLGVITSGAVTQTGALTVSGTTAIAAGAASAITLTTATNNFNTVTITSGGNVSLRDAGALDLGASTISGTLGITTGGALTQSGALTVTGATTIAAGTANNITLNHAGNNFGTVAVTSGNNVSLRDSNALILGASTISGNLDITTNGALTQTAAVTVAGTTTLAAGTANNITLSNSGNNFSSVAVTSGNNVSLRDSNALILGASTISGTLSTTTGGALSQSGVLSVAGTTSLAATAVGTDFLLNTQPNTFTGALSLSGTVANIRDVAIRNIHAGATVPTLSGLTGLRNLTLQYDNAAVLLPAVTLTSGGALTVTAGGTITQSGALVVPGATTVASGSNDITLTNASNNFSSVAVTSGNNVSLRDSNPLVLGTSAIAGNLAVTTGGALSQTGVVTVGGTTSLTATASASDMLLGTQANNFSGALSFGGTLTNIRDVSIRNVNAGATVPTLGGLTNLRNLTLLYDNAPVALPSLTLAAGNSLTVTAGGAITQSGAVVVSGTSTLNAGTSHNVTLTNAGNDFGTVAITSANNAALRDATGLVLGPSSLAGTLDITTSGAVTQSGALTVAGTTTVTAGAANSITLTNTANDFSSVTIVSGNNVGLRDITALNLGTSTISGTLDVITNGALTQSGPVTVTGASTLTVGAPNDIMLTNGGNNFSTVAVTSGHNVALRDATALDLGASTIGGTLDVTTNGALTQSGPLTVTGATTLTVGAANNIALTNAANDFSTLSIASGNNVALRDVNALDLGASTISGTLDVTSGGALTQSGALSVAGNATFDTTAAGTVGSVTIYNSTALGLGTSTIGGHLTASTGTGDITIPTSETITAAGDVTLTPSGMIALTGTIRNGGTRSLVGGTGSLITLGSDTNLNTLPLPGSGDVMIHTSGSTSLFSGAPLTGSAITLTNPGNTFGGSVRFSTTSPALTSTALQTYNLTQSAPVTLGSGRTLTITDLGGSGGVRGNVTLTNAGNSFDAVNITGGNIALTEAGPITIGSTGLSANSGTTSTGTLALSSTGAITQVGPIYAAGTTTLAAGTANNITLPHAANDFNTVSILSGNNVALRDTNALDLGTSTISSNLDVTTNGAVTQSGPLTVAGTTTLTVGSGNNITLTDAANDFSTVSIASGNNVALRDVNALDFGASTISGTLDVVTNGALTQSGPLTVTGATTLTVGATNDIALTNATNDFGSVAIVSGNNVALRDANALDFGASTISGTLNVVTNGALTQSGPLTVAGATTLDVGSGNDITLTNAANDFSSITIIRGNNVALRDATTLDLGTSTISGTLDVVTNGALTQSGPLTVTGATTLTVGATNDIALTNATNDFGSVAIVNGNNVALRDANALDLGASTITGTLDVVTNGALTQSGPLTVTGATTLTVGAANDITLTNATNDFSTVSIASGHNVALRDANALDLGASTVSGTLDVVANGALTQSGPLTVVGATTVATGTSTDITLTNASNDFSTVSIASGNNVALRDVNALDLGASTISGTLDVTSGGALTQSGALSVAGNATFDTTAAGTVGSVTIYNSTALGLGTSTVGGHLTASTGTGNITIPSSDTLTVTGDVTLAPGGIIDLTGILRDGGTRSFIGGSGSLIILGADTHLNSLILPGSGEIIIHTRGTTSTFAGPPLVGSAITLANPGNTFGGSVRFSTASPALTSTALQTYNLTQSAPVTLGSGRTLTITDLGGSGGVRGNVTLTNAGNSFDAVNITGGNIALTEAGPITIGSIGLSANSGATSTGTLALSSTGAITQVGPIYAAGTTTLAAGTANNITLPHAANDFNTVSVISGNNVALRDMTALDFGASTISGTLDVVTNGALSQNGPLTVAGATTLDVGSGNTITLTHAANDFNTVSITSGNNVALHDANALDFGASTISGTLEVIATGALTQSGAISTPTLEVVSGGAVTMTDVGNHVDTLALSASGPVQYTDADALHIATVGTTSGITSGNHDITLVTGGALAVDAPIHAGSAVLGLSSGGATTQSSGGTLTARHLNLAGTGPFTLTLPGNQVGTVGGRTSGSVQLVNAGTLTIGSVPAVGSLGAESGLTSTSGSVSIRNQSGDLVVASVSASNGSVDLDAAGSILSGSGTGLLALGPSTLTARSGVVGTLAQPIQVGIVNGTLGIAATGIRGIVSGVLNGSIAPSQQLTLLNQPPGLLCFNGCTVAGGGALTGQYGNHLSTGFNTLSLLNVEAIVPGYTPTANGQDLMRILSLGYTPTSLLWEPSLSIGGMTDGSVRQIIPPCLALDTCKPSSPTMSHPREAESD